MAKQIIAPSTVHPARGYSHAIKVGNTIYVAGQIALDREGNLVGGDNFEAQAEQAFQNLKAIIEAAGATMNDVVKVNIYLKRREDMQAMRRMRRKYFGDYFPPSTAVAIASLGLPEWLIEVEAIAVVE